MTSKVNIGELTIKVKQRYRDVAQKPRAAYHFELGRPFAVRLGYDADVLDQITAEAVESFAGRSSRRWGRSTVRADAESTSGRTDISDGRP